VHSFCKRPATYFALSVVVSALEALSHHPILPKGDDVKAAVMLGQRMSHLGSHEVTATYPSALAEWFVIDSDRVGRGQPLVRRHPPVSTR
jgi:hypothetical protein